MVEPLRGERAQPPEVPLEHLAVEDVGGVHGERSRLLADNLRHTGMAMTEVGHGGRAAAGVEVASPIPIDEVGPLARDDLRIVRLVVGADQLGVDDMPRPHRRIVVRASLARPSRHSGRVLPPDSAPLNRRKSRPHRPHGKRGDASRVGRDRRRGGDERSHRTLLRLTSMSGSLWSAFVAALPREGELRAHCDGSRAQIEPGLNTLLERGRTAWPRIELDAAAFAGAAARSLTDEEPAPKTLSELHAEDLYLTTACAGGDERAILAFQRTHAPAIERALAVADQHEVTTDEIVQAVWVRLFVDEAPRMAKVAAYAGRGKLSSWVRVVAARTRTDLLRKRLGRHPKPALPEAAPPLDSAADSPELRHLEATYRHEFRDAFARAVAGLEPAQRNMLRQRIVYGLRLEQMAALFEVHPATVKRRLARARQQLATETQRHLLAGLRVDQGELDSILRLIHSRMEVSVKRLLQSDE